MNVLSKGGSVLQVRRRGSRPQSMRTQWQTEKSDRHFSRRKSGLLKMGSAHLSIIMGAAHNGPGWGTVSAVEACCHVLVWDSPPQLNVCDTQVMVVNCIRGTFGCYSSCYLLFSCISKALPSDMRDSGGELKGTEGPFLCVRVSSSFCLWLFWPWLYWLGGTLEWVKGRVRRLFMRAAVMVFGLLLERNFLLG